MAWKRRNEVVAREQMARIFAFIVLYKMQHDGNSPTIREVMYGCKLASSSHAHYYLKRMEREGMLKRISPIETGVGVWQLKMQE